MACAAALGRSAQIFGLVIREGFLLALAGAVIGLVAAVASVRLLASMLYGVATSICWRFLRCPGPGHGDGSRAVSFPLSRDAGLAGLGLRRTKRTDDVEAHALSLRPRWPRPAACSAIYAARVSFFTGVPSSLLIPVYQAIEEAGEAYFPPPGEDLALAGGQGGPGQATAAMS